MRRCLAVIAMAAAVWLGSLAVPGWGRGGEPAEPISFISPPPDVGLPVGQGIEVRYRAEAAAVLELRVQADRPAEATHAPTAVSDVLAVDRVEAGEEVADFWAPVNEGRHCLVIRALPVPNARREAAPVTASRCVMVLPAGSSVRLHVESEVDGNVPRHSCRPRGGPGRDESRGTWPIPRAVGLDRLAPAEPGVQTPGGVPPARRAGAGRDESRGTWPIFRSAIQEVNHETPMAFVRIACEHPVVCSSSRRGGRGAGDVGAGPGA